MKAVVFTDLDGTLLDAATYSFDAAREGLQALRERGIPLIICSSKTRAEIEYFRDLLGNDSPFISENGGGIFIPKGHAEFDLSSLKIEIAEEDAYHVIRLGAEYQALIQGIHILRERGFNVRGFGDMTVYEVVRLTGLTPELAEMAKKREFDEPFLFEGGPEEEDALQRAATSLGFRLTRGRFLHLMGDSDKGRAVSMLIDMLARRFGKLHTIAVGDAPNDLAMLRSVDYPVIIKRPDGSYDPGVQLSNLIRADGIGPAGWNWAILTLIGQSGPSI